MIKSHEDQLKAKDSQLQEKDSENLHLKEELLKVKSGKEKLKDNLEKYRKENKCLQEDTAKKKRKQRSDVGKHRKVSTPSKNKRTDKPKGGNGAA